MSVQNLSGCPNSFDCLAIFLHNSQHPCGSLLNGAGVLSSPYPDPSVIEPLVMNTKSFSVKFTEISFPSLFLATIFF